MKQALGLLLLLLTAAPVTADEVTDDPPDDPPAADTGDVLDAVSDDAASEDAVGTVPVDTGEVAEAEPAAPWRLYLGVDQVNSALSVSGLPADAPSRFDSGMYLVRAGQRFGDNIGMELHVGLKQSTDQSDEVTTDSYYGLFVVPSTNLFDLFELGFPVGYAKNKVEGKAFDGVAYGIDAALPLKFYSDSLPDVRLTLGWMTYYQGNDARLYGLNFGLRYDFSVNGWGNPFAGMWPFGGDDTPAAE